MQFLNRTLLSISPSYGIFTMNVLVDKQNEWFLLSTVRPGQLCYDKVKR